MTKASEVGDASAKTAGERRACPAGRVQFETLVAVGDAKRGEGFEAESVDVSTDGMRLRTAYLPSIGDRLVCRLDGFGDEVLIEGEVIWRVEQPRGGEFGLRFCDLDSVAEEALRSLCGTPPPRDERAESAPVPAKNELAPPTGKVRLHIEGLSAPMKGRVRTARDGGVDVGTNLEFLRVGRALEIEAADPGGVRRAAFVDQVRVDVDPASNIPELVVSLRMAEAIKASAPPLAGATALAPTLPAEGAKLDVKPIANAEVHAGSNVDTTEKEGVASDTQVGASASPKSSKGRTKSGETQVPDRGEASAATPDDATDSKGSSQKPRHVAASAASAASAAAKGAREAGAVVAAKVVPVLAAVGERVGGGMRGMIAKVRERRGASASSADAAGKSPLARRTTSPPPGGALKTEGRRVVRDEEHSIEALEAKLAAKPRLSRKAALAGSALGLAVVLGVFGVVRATSGSASQTDARAALPAATTAPAAATSAAAETALAATGAPASVDVPLFGPTPLSTTEAIPPPPGAVAPPALADAKGQMAPSIEEPSLADEGKKEFGQGSVKDPIIIRLKMDGPVDKLSGSAGEMGFTVAIADRKALSNAQELARKDKRIAQMNVVNGPSGAELTVQFNDKVPPYLVRPVGDRVEIALGVEGKGSAAEEGDESSRASKHRVAAKGKSSGKGKKGDSKKAKNAKGKAKKR